MMACLLCVHEHATARQQHANSAPTVSCRPALPVRASQAAVHINLGYVYAEGGGQGLYAGAMPKAAGVCFKGAGASGRERER